MSPPKPTPSRSFVPSHHLLFLAILLLLLIAPLIFPATPLDGLILCPLRASTGVECAGCGMTRSWIALTSGELSDSLHFHPFGLLLYLAVAIKALFLIAELRLGRRLQLQLWSRIRIPALVTVGLAFIALGIIRAVRFIAA